MQPITLLVCDQDKVFLHEVEQATLHDPAVKVRTASDQGEAQRIIADRSIRIGGVCLNLNLCALNSLPVVKFCKTTRPVTPITLLSELPHLPFSAEELAGIQVQGVLRKPLSAVELVKELLPPPVFEFEKALALSRKSRTTPGEVSDSAGGLDYHPISAENFIFGSKCFFDIYVKVGETRFLMILKAGDQFDSERLLQYLSKGVTHFYISRDAQLYFLQYCDRVTQAMLARTDLSVSVKQDQVLELGEQTMGLLRRTGVSQAAMDNARRYALYVQQLLKQMTLSSPPVMRGLLQRIQDSEHSAGTVLVVALLLESMSYSDAEVVNLISTSAFLHDVGLYMLPDDLSDLDQEDMDAAQRKEYEKHPALGAELVSTLPNINPLIPQVILQHHERRNRRGFPAKLGGSLISPVAEIVGLGETFHHLLTRKSAIPPLVAVEERHFADFSFATVEGFRRAFGMIKKDEV